jgi:hypothetical protein
VRACVGCGLSLSHSLPPSPSLSLVLRGAHSRASGKEGLRGLTVACCSSSLSAHCGVLQQLSLSSLWRVAAALSQLTVACCSSSLSSVWRVAAALSQLTVVCCSRSLSAVPCTACTAESLRLRAPVRELLCGPVFGRSGGLGVGACDVG